MLKAYAVDTIILVRDDGYTKWNSPEAATPETVKGYVEWTTNRIRNIDGEEVVSSGTVLLPIDTTIDHRDKIQIAGINYPIIKIERGRDFSNVWVKVYVQ